jgi:hypothetical protein
MVLKRSKIWQINSKKYMNKLYNSDDYNKEMETLKEKGVKSTEDSDQEIMKLTEEIVKEAITKIKSHIMD